VIQEVPVYLDEQVRRERQDVLVNLDRRAVLVVPAAQESQVDLAAQVRNRLTL